MTADVTNIRCYLAKTVILDVLKQQYTLQETLNETSLLNDVKLIFIGESDCLNSTSDLFCSVERRNELLAGRVTLASVTSAATQTKDCSLSVTATDNISTIVNNITLIQN